MVGKINNNRTIGKMVNAEAEKGYFEFEGSSIVVLTELGSDNITFGRKVKDIKDELPIEQGQILIK